MNDSSDDYRVRMRRSDDLQFRSGCLALHGSHISSLGVFLYLICSLTWANGGSSRRNAWYLELRFKGIESLRVLTCAHRRLSVLGVEIGQSNSGSRLCGKLSGYQRTVCQQLAFN
jgi:hypothetical protein